MLANLISSLRNVVLWAVMIGVLWLGNLQAWETQVSGLMQGDAAIVEQTVDNHSVSPCNGRCIFNSMLCSLNAFVFANPAKVALDRKVCSVDWRIIRLALEGRAIAIEPEPPKHA